MSIRAFVFRRPGEPLPVLTPVAAAGLVVIMTGAVTLTAARGPAATAIVPFVVGILAAVVAYGRWRIVPLEGSR